VLPHEASEDHPSGLSATVARRIRCISGICVLRARDGGALRSRAALLLNLIAASIRRATLRLNSQAHLFSHTLIVTTHYTYAQRKRNVRCSQHIRNPLILRGVSRACQGVWIKAESFRSKIRWLCLPTKDRRRWGEARPQKKKRIAGRRVVPGETSCKPGKTSFLNDLDADFRSRRRLARVIARALDGNARRIGVAAPSWRRRRFAL